MTDVIGQILPIAVGVAVSPLPIIAAILLLLSPTARTASIGFVVGWVSGIIAAVTVFTLVGSVIPAADPDASKPIQGVLSILFGILLLALGVTQFPRRNVTDAATPLPVWMQAVDHMTALPAFGIGFLLAAVNPKNTMMSATAGIDVGAAALPVGAVVIVIGVYTLIAASTVLVPVLGHLITADRLGAALGAVRQWLTRENAVIMAVLLLVLGVTNIGKGIGRF